MYRFDLTFNAEDTTYAPLNVRIVENGEQYGQADALTHNGTEPLVEFFDARHPHTPDGQFISRYYLSVIMSVIANGGALNLAGGEPEWTASDETMATLGAYIDTTAIPHL